MRTARILSLVALLLLASPSARAESQPSIPPGVDFGAGLTLAEPTLLAEVVRSPERFAESPVLLRGRISEVCQKKGCWVVLRDGGEQLRVRFHDYGFFLPTDASGSEAYVEGTVEVVELSEKMARHYEAESKGGDPSAVTGPRREVGFTATGVRIVGSR
jgi:hypothetical protein